MLRRRRRGGVRQPRRSPALKAFELKKKQVEDTGAEHFVTACGQCRITLTLGAKKFKWDKKVESLLELVADNLAD